MIYLSKGTVCKGSTQGYLKVAHFGSEFALVGSEATLWLSGQFGFAETNGHSAIKHLERMGLVEYEQEDSLSPDTVFSPRSICCPAKSKNRTLFLSPSEKELLTWLTKSSLRLTTAELISLSERGIKPVKNLLYTYNRQALVETIYMTQHISDNILETQMERSVRRDAVVNALMRLLRKKRLVIL